MTTNTSDSLIPDSLTAGGSQSQNTEGEIVRQKSSNVQENGSERSQASQPDERLVLLQKQREKRAGEKAQSRFPRRKSPAAAVMIQQLAPEELSWKQKAIRRLAGFAATGYGVSFLFHVVMLILFSLFVLPHAFDNRFQINATEGEQEGTEDKLVELVDTRLDFPSPKPALMTPVNLIPIPLPADDSARVIDTIQHRIAANLEDFEEEHGGGAFPDGGKKGKNAVTKGNFTAWTVPDDPRPGQYYHIFIEVNLPKKIRRYDAKDLTGYLIDTNGWTTPIGYFEGGRITPKGIYHRRKYYGHFNRKKHRLVIRIPPAEALVEDTIKVRSKLLKEEQSLKIVF